MTEHLHYVTINGTLHVCRGAICANPRLMALANGVGTPVNSYGAPSLDCMYRGDKLVDEQGESVMAECKQCSASRGKPTFVNVFACKVFGSCTMLRTGVGIVGRCNECSERKPPMPDGTILVDLPDHYNCSIVEFQGKTLLASRLDRPYAQTWLSELGADLQPLWSRKLADEWEDTRLFVHEGALYCSFTWFDKVANIGLAKLKDDLTVEWRADPVYVNRNSWEKNWAPFSHEGRIHYVYSIQPHKLHVFDGVSVDMVSITSSRLNWPGHLLRGGAAPVRIGELYYHWLHSVTKMGSQVIYGAGVYAFQASPPFAIVKGSRSPIIANSPPYKRDKSVVFPCGAIFKDGKWLVSYGVDDKECRISTYTFDEIEAKLEQY